MEDLESMGDNPEEENGDPLTSLPAFKNLVVGVLEKNELSQKRASKMEILDFLNLLSVFNK